MEIKLEDNIYYIPDDSDFKSIRKDRLMQMIHNGLINPINQKPKKDRTIENVVCGMVLGFLICVFMRMDTTPLSGHDQAVNDAYAYSQNR